MDIKMFFTIWGSFMIANVKAEDEKEFCLEYPGYVVTPQPNAIALMSPFNFCKDQGDLLKKFGLKKEHVVFESTPEDVIVNAYLQYKAKAYQETTGIITPTSGNVVPFAKGRQ